MDGAHEVPDATDWLNTPLQDFATLESALHCEICKEFYETPMITSCSHTFCSKCIRTALSTDGRCPSCRTADQASKLRNNWVLQQVVDAFVNARPAAIDVARRAAEATDQQKKPGKRKRTVLDSDDVEQAEQEKRTTRSKSRRIAASQTSQPESIEIVDSDGDEDGDYEPEKVQDDGLVECPLGCGKRMKIEAVEPHLDRCEDEKKHANRAKSRTPANNLSSSRPSSTQPVKPQERLSELNYSLLNETKMRTKLKELNIPNWGSKQLMIKRHTEWVNLWNANCDSKRPRSEKELLKDLDVWERTQGGRAPSAGGLATNIMRKDFDGSAWVNKNKDDFSRLIAEAKRRKSNPAMDPERPKPMEAAVEDLNHEPNGVVNVGNPLPGYDSELPSQHGFSEPIRPYEDNQVALNSIREKVEAANAGKPIEPVMNAGFESTRPNGTSKSNRSPYFDQRPSEPHAGVEDPALLEQSHFGLSRGNSQDEHATNMKTGSECDLPSHLQSSPKKLPMFAVPQQPFSDVDGAGGGGGVGEQ